MYSHQPPVKRSYFGWSSTYIILLKPLAPPQMHIVYHIHYLQTINSVVTTWARYRVIFCESSKNLSKLIRLSYWPTSQQRTATVDSHERHVTINCFSACLYNFDRDQSKMLFFALELWCERSRFWKGGLPTGWRLRQYRPRTGSNSLSMWKSHVRGHILSALETRCRNLIFRELKFPMFRPTHDGSFFVPFFRKNQYEPKRSSAVLLETSQA